MLHLLASCQVTERLVAFFRREGDNLKSLQSSLHIYSLEVQTEVKKILFRETNWHWHWVKATTSCLPRPQCFETCVCRFSSQAELSGWCEVVWISGCSPAEIIHFQVEIIPFQVSPGWEHLGAVGRSGGAMAAEPHWCSQGQRHNPAVLVYEIHLRLAAS